MRKTQANKETVQQDQEIKYETKICKIFNFRNSTGNVFGSSLFCVFLNNKMDQEKGSLFRKEYSIDTIAEICWRARNQMIKAL